MSNPMIFVPLNVEQLSDEEIARYLRSFSEDFPFCGDNYASAILQEAAKRADRANL
jgi:hypothetical protein